MDGLLKSAQMNAGFELGLQWLPKIHRENEAASDFVESTGRGGNEHRLDRVALSTRNNNVSCKCKPHR